MGVSLLFSFSPFLLCFDLDLGRAKKGRRQWYPTPVLLPGKSLGQRSLAGYSPWRGRESHVTEHAHISLTRNMKFLDQRRDLVLQSFVVLKAHGGCRKTMMLPCELIRQGFHSEVFLAVCVLNHFNRVRLSVTPWTVAHQAPLSVGFFRQECWSGLPCPPPGDLPDSRTEPIS